MSNYRDADYLLGKRFLADFTVLAIGADQDRTVTLRMMGDDVAQISLDELLTIIESGFVAEVGPFERRP